MRCAVIFSNLVNRAWEQYSTRQYYDEQLYTANVKYLAPGTYTLTAETDPDPEVGKDITCYARGEKNDGTAWTYPASGENALPMTFTVSEVSDVRFFFGYEGFRDVMPGEGDEIALSAVSAVKCGKPGKPDRDIYESAVMLPDEISDSCALAQGIGAKSSVTLRIFPDFESWGFCRRSITLVRVIDLERAEDRMIFKGRVSAISDIMENGGAVRQDVVCVSAADFLEDTAFANGIEPQSLTTWLGTRCAAHNSQVELARRYTFTVGGSAAVSSGTEYLCKTNFEILNEVLTGEKYLRENGEIVKYEWRERYHNDIAYIDTAAKIGAEIDTPFEIGDNLTSIAVTQDINGGIYTSVMVISGINSDGCRATATAANGAMIARYGNGRQLVIVNDDIYFTGPGGREYTSGGGWNWHVTPAVEAMEAALQAYANQEAAKLSEPPIKITLTAVDLAAMGFTGYEPFEVGNSHPLVYPPGGYFGQRVRITGIRRRLSDGRIEQITIAQGQQPGKRSGGTMSAQIAKLSAANTAATDERKIVEIADQKVETQTDGIKTLRVTRARYDSIQHDPDTLYIIDDEGDKSMALGNDPIMREGGGGGTIETAAVLSSEQMVYWAPAHELVPVWFRGNAAVYYGQAPAKMVIQGQRANFGSPAITNEDIMSEIALDFRDGSRQKLKIYIHRLSLSSMQLGVICYDISGASEVFVGAAASSYEFAVSGGTVQIGMILTVSELYANEDLDLAPRYGVMLAVKTGDTVQTASLPAIGASKFTGSNVDFSDDAECGFASGIARYTEPSGG